MRYTAEHVNRFYRAVDANLAMPARYICITDEPEGIEDGIEILPMWEDYREWGGCYTRLKLFDPRMVEILGERFVSVDLDSVICGSLDPVFDRPEDFIIWKNVGAGSLYCGSMFMMNAGCRPQVLSEFDPKGLVFKRKGFKQRSEGRWAHHRALEAGNIIGSDQAMISTILGPEEAMWTERDGVMSFKRDIIGANLLSEARIIFFHGVEDPSQKELWKKHPWIEEHWR